MTETLLSSQCAKIIVTPRNEDGSGHTLWTNKIQADAERGIKHHD